MTKKIQSGTIMVVGGGISGMTAAIEAAEVGFEVLLVEREPYLGGRVLQMNQYFPKLCPPSCGLEINQRRIKQSPRLRVLTQSEVESVQGNPGAYKVTIKTSPRFVNERCTACGACGEVCPKERPNDFNYGMDRTKAIYLSSGHAYPQRSIIDPQACAAPDCQKCVDACPYGAIDLNQAPRTQTFPVSSIVWATGWRPYDPARLTNLAFGRVQNVITNVMYERLAAQDGPTKGRILRPSDGQEPHSIAFVQCAGSRDENHLPYCSAVCCSATVKQIFYTRERLGQAKIMVFYIDLRTMGRNEDLLSRLGQQQNVDLIKGKVALIDEDPAKDPILTVEETLTGNKRRYQVGLVVLATGMVPATDHPGLPRALNRNADGFLADSPGLFATGCAHKAQDVAASVRDSTGAALKAIQVASAPAPREMQPQRQAEPALT